MASGGNTGSRPLGVYVHFPFCASRCSYCDFPTEARAVVPHEAYAAAICAELAFRQEDYAGRRLRSVYFGGGTPGLWKAECVRRVLEHVCSAFADQGTQGLSSGVEVTLEMNPGDVRLDDLRRLREGGVTRLSLGVQSLHDDELALLGRRHSSKEALRSIELARAAGFEHIACDLMFGLPSQSPSRFLESLREVVGFGPEHVSVYCLTLEEGTPLFARVQAGDLELPDDEVQVAMFEMGRQLLLQAGFRHYEISNFAMPGREAVHNNLYWTGGEYLGLGAAAHSMRYLPGGGVERRANPRDPDAYITSAMAGTLCPENIEILDTSKVRREALWLGLRLLEGISRKEYEARHGVDPAAVAGGVLAELVSEGLLEMTPECVRLTWRGVLFADEVGARLLAGGLP